MQLTKALASGKDGVFNFDFWKRKISDFDGLVTNYGEEQDDYRSTANGRDTYFLAEEVQNNCALQNGYPNIMHAEEALFENGSIVRQKIDYLK